MLIIVPGPPIQSHNTVTPHACKASMFNMHINRYLYHLNPYFEYFEKLLINRPNPLWESGYSSAMSGTEPLFLRAGFRLRDIPRLPTSNLSLPPALSSKVNLGTRQIWERSMILYFLFSSWDNASDSYHFPRDLQAGRPPGQP